MSFNRSLTSQIHPDDRFDAEKLARGTVRHVAVNDRESPLSWLFARKMVSERQYRAGEALRRDYERAGLGARVTMRWDAPPAGRKRSGGRASDAAVGQIDARNRFNAAMEAAGPGLSDICWRVLCAGEAMGEAEKAMGWPSRSGRLVLTLALNRLADFYGVG